jgi:hypothetical protein
VLAKRSAAQSMQVLIMPLDFLACDLLLLQHLKNCDADFVSMKVETAFVDSEVHEKVFLQALPMSLQWMRTRNAEFFLEDRSIKSSSSLWSHLDLDQRRQHFKYEILKILTLFDEVYEIPSKWNVNLLTLTYQKTENEIANTLKGHEAFFWLCEQLDLVFCKEQVCQLILPTLARLKGESETNDVVLLARLLELEGDFHRVSKNFTHAESAYSKSWRMLSDVRRKALLTVKILGLEKSHWTNPELFKFEWARLLKQLELANFSKSNFLPIKGESIESLAFDVLQTWSRIREQSALKLRHVKGQQKRGSASKKIVFLEKDSDCLGKKKLGPSAHWWDIFSGSTSRLSGLNFPYLADKASILASELLTVLKSAFCSEHSYEKEFLAVAKLAFEAGDFATAGESIQIYVLSQGPDASTTLILSLLDTVDECSSEKGCSSLYLSNAVLGFFYGYFVLGNKKVFERYFSRMDSLGKKHGWNDVELGMIELVKSVYGNRNQSDFLEKNDAMIFSTKVDSNGVLELICRCVCDRVFQLKSLAVDSPTASDDLKSIQNRALRFLKSSLVPLAVQNRLRAQKLKFVSDNEIETLMTQESHPEAISFSNAARSEGLEWMAHVLWSTSSGASDHKLPMEDLDLWNKSAHELLNLLKICADNEERVQWVEAFEVQLRSIGSLKFATSLEERRVG